LSFASTTKIASLTGNKTITDINGNDITSTALSDAVEVGDSRVILETGVASWTSLDNVYPSVCQAANFFGADYILGEYADDKDQATTFYQKALDICASIANSTTQGLVIRVKAYRSYPLNPDATIYRSIPSAGSDSLSG
jgi:hypothetical protein